ncbi:MAG: GAF domain-containing protein, partial [Kiritimatiellae bacterium]|nr:GAF domain-containing protein [Kiritimatiellia bacterium]
MSNENTIVELYRKDRELFSSLLKHVVQAAPSEDPSNFVLATIGRNVGADRCYVYRFWDSGKTSMCTNTHEWCAEGIKPEIGGQQTCNLADLVEFNARITSGRDFLFTDINSIDPGSRDWLEPQGIQSLIATPLVGTGGTIFGFAGFDFVRAPCPEFTDRIIFNIHEAADLLLNCQRLHERNVAQLDVAQRENEYEANEREFERALTELQKDASTVHPKQMLEIVRNRLDADICYMVQDISPAGGGTIRPGHALARDGWTNARSWTIDSGTGRALDTRLMTSALVTFRESEIAWLRGCIEQDESPPPELARRLKVVHSVGIRQDGALVGVLCVGYTDERRLSIPLTGFLRRAALVIVTTLERIATYHDLTVALNLAAFKGDVVEFMFKHDAYEEIRNYIGAKVCEITGAQHIMLCSDDGSRADWFGEDAPPCCHDCVKAAVNFGKRLPNDFFTKGETVIVPEGSTLPNMNLPSYCPMRSSVISQFRQGDGWWRMVADYTRPHSHDLAQVARGLRLALELLAISHDRQRREETIARMQEHQSFRADT